MELKDKKLFLFDIDGVIKLGDNVICGSKELYEYIKSIGGKSIFFTNNSTKSNSDYVKYFNKLGFDVKEDNFITALTITILFLKENHINDKIFVVGTKSLVKELKANNLKITDKVCDDVKVVLVAYDNELNYKKLEDVCQILQTKDISYYATNSDLRCPTDFGFIPDCGSIVQIIKNTTDKEPKYLGKPNPEMVYHAIKQNKFTKEQTVVIGDRLYTDIACGINAGIDTCAVLSGEVKRKDLINAEYKPTYVFDSVKEIFESLSK